MKDLVRGAISVSEHLQRRPKSALGEILDVFDVILDVFLIVSLEFCLLKIVFEIYVGENEK